MFQACRKDEGASLTDMGVFTIPLNFCAFGSAPRKPATPSNNPSQRNCGQEAQQAAAQVPSAIPDTRSLIDGVVGGVVSYLLPPQYGGGSATGATVGFVVGTVTTSVLNFFESNFRYTAQIALCNHSQGNMGIPLP